MTGLNPSLPGNVPLILKASCDERLKRIRFPPDLSALQYPDFRRKVAGALQFEDVDFTITWEDDDGEHCEIASTEDLQEALLYYLPSDPDAAPGAISMRVTVRVDTGVSLSDFGGSSVYGDGGSDEEEERQASEKSYRAPSLTSWSSSSSAPRAPPSGKVLSRQETHDSYSGTSSSSYSSYSSISKGGSGGDGRRIQMIRYDGNSRKAYTIEKSSAGKSISTSSTTDSLADGPSRSLEAAWSRARGGSGHRAGNSSLTSSALGHSLLIDSLDFRKTSLDDGNSSGSDAESEATNVTRGPVTKTSPPSRTKGRGHQVHSSVHQEVACRSCKTRPITGPRYHCASCDGGADFCTLCERSGKATSVRSHDASHLVIKISVPLDTEQSAVHFGQLLNEAQRRLAREASSTQSSSRSLASSSADSRSSSATSLHQHMDEEDDVMTSDPIQCSFCSSAIHAHETRYLCANCPVISLDGLTGKTNKEGFNLCASCETHSLQCHDPSHFFFKIQGLPRGRQNPSSRRVRLGDRWEIKELGGGALAPTLYADLTELATSQQQQSTSGPQQNTGVISQIPGSYRFSPSQSPSASSFNVRSLPSSEANCPSSPFRRWTMKACATSSSSSSSSSSGNSSTNNTVHCDGHDKITVQSSSDSGNGGRNENSFELESFPKPRPLVPLQQLVHPSILCDNCYVVVEGKWFRCSQCTSSYDLCQRCESRIAHNPSHSFAVFKQPVDLDLFKSCVDHQDGDAADVRGSTRPMLSFSLS